MSHRIDVKCAVARGSPDFFLLENAEAWRARVFFSNVLALYPWDA
jgi:hypothetical protein